MGEVIVFYASIPVALLVAFILATLAVHTGDRVLVAATLIGLPAAFFLFITTWHTVLLEKEEDEVGGYRGLDGFYDETRKLNG